MRAWSFSCLLNVLRPLDFLSACFITSRLRCLIYDSTCLMACISCSFYLRRTAWTSSHAMVGSFVWWNALPFIGFLEEWTFFVDWT